jgi:hypothetical protein
MVCVSPGATHRQYSAKYKNLDDDAFINVVVQYETTNGRYFQFHLLVNVKLVCALIAPGPFVRDGEGSKHVAFVVAF